MMHKPAAILEEISSFMQLADNDIIMTGTPKGVGKVKSGDHFEATLYQQGQTQPLLSQQWTAV